MRSPRHRAAQTSRPWATPRAGSLPACRRLAPPLVATACLWLAALLPAAGRDDGAGDDAPADAGTHGSWALSLRNLQQALSGGEVAGGDFGRALRMDGLTRVDGFAIDSLREDLVLVGRREPGAPHLDLDDFVVALRNAYRRYARIEDDRRIYAPPGCSLEPDSAVVVKLRRLAERISAAGAEEVDSLRAAWMETCRRPQRVEVWGVPGRSGFADVMLAADYAMKAVADGGDSLALPGFVSYRRAKEQDVRDRLARGRHDGLRAMGAHRFWFQPGRLEIAASSAAVALEACPVWLLTEEQHLSAAGRASDAGRSDPIAERFCAQFTERFAEIAAQRREFHALEQVFRMFALALLMHEHQAFRRADLPAMILLDTYEPRDRPVPTQLPGRPHAASIAREGVFDGRQGTLRIWVHGCGGVSIDVRLDEAQVDASRSDSLARWVDALLAAPRDPDEIGWAAPSSFDRR